MKVGVGEELSLADASGHMCEIIKQKVVVESKSRLVLKIRQ